MFESHQTTCELVLFWDGESIDKSMLFTDFEATLDGVVGIPGYGGELKHAAYVQLTPGLQVRSCALFTVHFEESGFADRNWNIPLRHMVEIAARGPDLGGGAIQLACRSQCPISWHAPALWDPVMEPGFNTFKQIQREVEQATKRFGFRPAAGSAPTPVVAVSAPSETDIPVLTDEAPDQQAQALALEWEAEREELRKRLREQQLHIATLETDKNETVNRLGFLHQQQVDILEAQNSKLLAQFKAMKAQGETQREQMDAMRNQVESLSRLDAGREAERRLHEEQMAAAIKSQAGEDQKLQDLLQQKEQEFAARESRIREEHRLSLEQRSEEEASRHQLQLSSLLTELRERDNSVQRLEYELRQLRESQAGAQQNLVDTLLRELSGLGINFVVYHPGVGNISVPVNELGLYMQNPVAYAAAKCMVGVELYQIWLDHHNDPRCLAKIGENKCCDMRLIRVDSPSKFVPGQSDRCARHQSSDAAIANVLRFR